MELISSGLIESIDKAENREKFKEAMKRSGYIQKRIACS
jgi:carbamoylphosphate synthase large subunit